MSIWWNCESFKKPNGNDASVTQHSMFIWMNLLERTECTNIQISTQFAAINRIVSTTVSLGVLYFPFGNSYFVYCVTFFVSILCCFDHVQSSSAIIIIGLRVFVLCVPISIHLLHIYRLLLPLPSFFLLSISVFYCYCIQ